MWYIVKRICTERTFHTDSQLDDCRHVAPQNISVALVSENARTIRLRLARPKPEILALNEVRNASYPK
jgi:hypothetical protein